MKKTLTPDQREKIEDTIVRELADRGDEIGVQINIGPKKINSPPFFMVYQATSLMVSKNIYPSTLMVFWHLCCKLDYSSHIGVNQKTVAEEIRMPLRTVKSAFAELIARKMIVAYQDSQDARRNVYIINPNVAWKGTEKRRKQIVKKDPNQFDLSFPENEKLLKGTKNGKARV